MLYSSTHKNTDAEKEVDQLVGKSYSFFTAIKMKGTGSKRMIVEKVSPNLQKVVNLVADLNYGNIELRPRGIVIHITKGLKNFSWAIPYYQLVIYRSGRFSIHADGKFVQFKSNKLLKENKKFIDKLITLKIEHTANHNFIH